MIKMVKAELGDDLIVKTIGASDNAFDTSPDALLQLKSAGVSKPVMDAMIEAAAKNTGSATSNAKPAHSAPLKPPELTKGESLSESRSPLIFVEEVSSSGGIVASSDSTLEAIKTLREKGIRVTTNKEKADFVLQITRQLGKKSWKKDTKIALSNRDGEVVLAKSTRSVGGAMGGVVEFVRKRSE